MVIRLVASRLGGGGHIRFAKGFLFILAARSARFGGVFGTCQPFFCTQFFHILDLQ